MPQFVLLEHDHPELHWDFMLELDDVLLTWRLDRIPDKAGEIAAVSLSDHRMVYLDYEGPISGNRGSVKRIQSGRYSMTASLDEARQQYSLIDCDLGTLAICHQSENGSVQWWFE